MSVPPPPEPSPVVLPSSTRWPRWVVGCTAALALAAAIPIGGWAYWSWSAEQARQAALAQQEQKAKETFEPALKQLRAVEPSYDIDKTIRVVHEIDAALRDHASLRDHLANLAQRDYRGVAPDVLEARRKILEIVMRLYGKQLAAEDQQAAWEFTSELLLSTMSVVSVSGDVSLLDPSGNFSVDPVQARQVLDDLQSEQAERRQLQRDIQDLEEELFAALMDYSKVYYRYVDEWDRLCVLRDRAYLAAHNRDWDTANVQAEAAIQAAPQEREAHLVKALALIEGGGPDDAPEAAALLDAYVTAHPAQSAPAFLLRGVLAQKLGQRDQAKLDFQQAAAYYPRQSSQLAEMLDPYRMRSFLRKSREGGYILELYQSTMLGAGYFSPDLQMAKISFDEGNAVEGQRKVMDHFARRRSQAQWDLVLQDIAFAHQLLGPDFRAIFPDEAWLDLEVAPTLWGDKVRVGVNNRSDRTLHNATLILAVHFTDMHPADYEPFAAPATMPAVIAHESTDFGEMSVQTELWGKSKSVADIVEQRAVLLTDEAVLWVDSEPYKIAETRAFREAQQRRQPHPQAGTATHARMRERMTSLTPGLSTQSAIEVVPKYGFDDALVIQLPASLAVFRPVFTLEYAGRRITADSNHIEGDRIVLTFAGVDNFDGGAVAQDATLHIESVFGAITAVFRPDGSMKYRFGTSAAQ
jgi:hypothetical protein